MTVLNSYLRLHTSNCNETIISIILSGETSETVATLQYVNRMLFELSLVLHVLLISADRRLRVSVNATN